MPFSDDAMGWSGEHRGFVVETFFKNNESVIATQRAFRRHFRLGRRAPVPDPKNDPAVGFEHASYWNY